MRSLVALFCIAFIANAQSNPGCLKDWSYFAKSNKCFKVFGGEFDSIRPMIWDKSQDYCNTFNGGHLASLHSDDELLFVVGLSQQAPWDNGGASEIHVGHRYLGNSKWEWTDGSPWIYTKWYSDTIISDVNYAAQNPRGILHTRQVVASTMWVRDGSNSYAFACQMPPSSEG